MGVVNIKNEIKTLLLIVNTMNMIAAGLLPLSIFVGLLINIQNLSKPIVITFYLFIAIAMLTITTIGSCGAILEKKIMLDAYIVLTGLAAVVEVGALLSIAGVFGPESFVFCRFHPCIMVISMVLAVILAKQVRRERSPIPSAPIATAL